MTISEFKTIYYWEYGHRMFGRLIGCAFTFPFLYYAVRGRISRNLYGRLGALLALGGNVCSHCGPYSKYQNVPNSLHSGSQGLIGWWMVRSGLEEEGNQTFNDLPRVSPYRLATHLSIAFVLYSGLLYNGMLVYSQRHAVQSMLQQIGVKAIEGAAPSYRLSVSAMTLFAASTAIMGAFVAGNEAGLVYNEWPRMGLGLIPSDLVNPYIEPKWKNLFENSTAIQFVHRNLAYCTVIGSVALFVYTRRLCAAHQLTQNVLFASGTLMAASLMQSTLGILTLIHYIPIPLASMHQAGSLTVLGAAVWLLFLSRRNGYAASNKLMNQLMRNGKPAFLVI